MADLNVMPFFTDAYLADTIHLSTEEHGAYLLLLVACWRAGGTLPNDHDLLRRICKVTPKHWPKVWAVVGNFFHAEGQVLTQKKLASTYAHQMERLAKARQNGKLGGRPKSLKNNNTPKPSGSHPVIAQETGRISEREPDENRTDIKTETGTEPDPRLSMNHKPRKEGVSREGTLGDIQGDSRHREDSTGGRVDWFNRSATEIVARLAEAAQENVVRGTTEIELVQPIRDLLALGADFEHDILPAIAERVPKLTTPLRSWGARWLRDEIMARKAARLNRHGKAPEPRKPEAWDLRLALFKSHGAWRSEFGPRPGSIGCRAPPELLAEYGLLPSTDQ